MIECFLSHSFYCFGKRSRLQKQPLPLSAPLSFASTTMPVYIAVRCFQCEMFQVIQKPKSNKFNCRVCSAKQSVRTAYATSTKAKECRGVVQKYNRKAGEKTKAKTEAKAAATVVEEGSSSGGAHWGAQPLAQEVNFDNYENVDWTEDAFMPGRKQSAVSQWDEFLSDDGEGAGRDGGSDDDDEDGEEEYVLSLPSKKATRKRKKATAAAGPSGKAPKKPRGRRTNRRVEANSKHHSSAAEASKRSVVPDVRSSSTDGTVSGRALSERPVSNRNPRGDAYGKPRLKNITRTERRAAPAGGSMWDEFLDGSDGDSDD